MRVTSQEREIIRGIFKNLDPNADIFLFGSRVDDTLKGGDLDILILSEALSFSDKITALALLKEKLGDQKIDLIISAREKASQDPFIQSITSKAIQIG
jgi:predicted nucleotidyltransferase